MKRVQIASVALALCFLASCFIASDSRARLTPILNRGTIPELYQNNAAAQMSLSELKLTKHVYALGPLSQLRGEILIWDSEPFEARVLNGQIQVKSDWNESAAFLVWSVVPKWQKTSLPPSVMNLRMMESWLRTISGRPGSPLREQYPFLLKGKMSRALWHLVNCRDDGQPLTPDKHRRQKFHGETRNMNVECVGFYAPEDQNVFIPSGQSTHIHMKVGEELIAHLDDFELDGESQVTLYVPARGKL